MPPERAANLQGIRLPQSFFVSLRTRAASPAACLGRRIHRLHRHHLLAAVVASGSLLPGCGVGAQQAASRTQRFLAQRVPSTAAAADGRSAALALQQARAQHLALQRETRATAHTANLTAAWQPLGPSSIVSASFGNVTGRIAAIALDPNDATGNTVYLGTTGGGVWKSTNAAGALANAGFVPLTDTLPVFAAGGGVIASLSIGAVAVQPQTNPIVLAGTGDPNDATDSLYGEGLLRSTDGGATWTLIQNSHDGVNGNHSLSGLATAGIAFSTATPTLVVAAFSTSPQSAIVAAAGSASVPGLYYSTDAGQSWQMATLTDGATIVQQPQPLGTGQVGNAVTSVVWDALRAQFFAAVRGHGYYASSDGANWTRLPHQPGANLTTANCPALTTTGSGSPSCPIFRGALAVQPATGDLYALTVDANDLDQGLWQDLCNASGNTCATSAPVFANRLDNGTFDNGSGAIAQGSYDLSLAAAPAAAGGTLLFAGTVDLYRCALAAGATSCTWRNTTNALNGCNAPAKVAPAQHALAAVAQSTAPLLFVGNDGGLWRSTDGVAQTGSVCAATDSQHFDNLNTAIGTAGSLTEVVGLAQHPTDPDTLLAGAGANGSAATTTAAQRAAWPQLSAGEGGLPALDASTPTNWSIAIGAGVNVAQCKLGSACTAANFAPPATVGEPQVSDDASLLEAPTLLDPALTTNLLAGTCRVWRGAASGAGWSTANAISAAFDSGTTPCGTSSALVRSVGAGGPSAATGSAQTSGSTVLYAGLAGVLDGGGSSKAGHLFVTTAANNASSTTAWTDAALSAVTNDVSNAQVFNPAGFDVSSIAVDSHDATGATVYATVMGFGVPHLYRSTDFGAHWLNVSANLPDAPANAVAIDPNDANTVYVALDTGVYVTQQIATCPTANCWSVLGTSLPNAPVVALAAGAGLPTGDGRLGLLRAATYGRGIWQTPLLTAISLAQPALTLSAASFTFAAQQVQTQSAAQTLTVTSSGNAPLTFTTLVTTGDFTETDNCAGQTLAVNATCTVQIVFAPTATGTRTGQLTLYANIAGGQATVSLTGTGTAPAAITLTPPALTFAATIVNQTTAAQIVTVANTGGNPATLQAPVISGDFSISNNTCGSTLPATTACAIAITFTPTAGGQRSGTLSITDSAGTQTAQLSGTGQAPATDTLAPLALSFAQQQLNTTSAAQQVTLSNAGDVALTLITASITGDFSVVNGCATSLAAHASCAFNVSFTPTAVGARSGVLTISDQFRSQTVTLNGSGVAPPGVSLSPASLSFSATGIGLSSVPQTLTLTNNGGLPLSISAVAVSPGFSIVTNTCATTLAANAACTLSIVFAPSAAGTVSGTLTLTDNAPGSTQTASLSGTGVDFTLAANGPTSATLSSGGSASYSLLLSSLPVLSGNVAFTCTGAPANSICTVTPAVGALGVTQTIAVTVQTGVTVVELMPFQRNGIELALLLALPLAWRRRRTLRAHLLPLLLVALVTLTACSTAARVIPPASGPATPTPTTPTGTYNLTVSGASAGVTHSVGLTLIVQ
jgi:hypothetical protein